MKLNHKLVHLVLFIGGFILIGIYFSFTEKLEINKGPIRGIEYKNDGLHLYLREGTQEEIVLKYGDGFFTIPSDGIKDYILLNKKGIESSEGKPLVKYRDKRVYSPLKNFSRFSNRINLAVNKTDNSLLYYEKE